MERDQPAFWRLRGPAVAYGLAAGYLALRWDSVDAWVGLAVYAIASVWWLVAVMRTSWPMALELVAVWAPAVLPVILLVLLQKAFAYSDAAAAIAAFSAAPFIAVFLIAPAVCAVVLLFRRLSSPRRPG